MKKIKSDAGLPVFLGLVLLLLALAGCKPQQADYVALDEAETLMFSDSIKAAIQLYDGNFFLEHQDLLRTEDRLREFGASGPILDRSKEVMAFFSLPDGILLGNPQEGTEWNYVEITRLRERDGKRVIQIRTHDQEFIFDYYEFLVEKRSYKGLEKIVISDYFSYNSGQWASHQHY